MRNWRNDSGQVLVLTALSMMLLLGFMGFATDVGQLFHARRSLQIAADDAAIAGATAYKFDNEAGSSSSTISTDIDNAASAALRANGLSNVAISSAYSSSVTSPTLFITSPPADGPNTNSTGFVEAVLTVPQSTTFMSMFGFKSVNVYTRAVAGPGDISQPCIYVLEPTGAETMYMGGNFNVEAPGCGIVVNSTDPCALYFNGGGTGGISTLHAGWVDVAGGACKQVSDSNPPPVTGSGIQLADPYLNVVTWPVISQVCNGSNTVSPTSGSTITISSNTVSEALPIAHGFVCFTAPVNISGPPMPTTASSETDPCNGATNPSNYTNLPSAIYIFEGGVNFKGGCIASLGLSSGGGVTFDLDCSTCTSTSFNVATQTAFALYPMATSITCSIGCTSYGNAGIIIEQPPDNTSALSINQGTSFGTIEGVIYDPAGQLLLIDQGASSNTSLTLNLVTQLVVWSLSDQASNLTLINYANTNNSALKHVTLVE